MRSFLLLSLLLLCLPAARAQTCELPAFLPERYGLKASRWLDTESGSWVEADTVWVSGGLVTSSAPEPTPVFDLCDAVLVPGLADMHVHVRPEDLDAYLAAGVTTVRNLWGWPGLRSIMADVEASRTRGPHMVSVSSGIDGLPEKWPFTQVALTPEAGKEAVGRMQQQGWTSLKLYQDLPKGAFLAVVDEARKRGMDFGGHVSRKVGLDLALASGYRFIEHLSGYKVELNPDRLGGAQAWRRVDEVEMATWARRTVEAGTWNCPTLAIFSLISRGDPLIRRQRQRMVHVLHEAGASLLIGTDSGIGQTRPGASIHDEMQEFLEAGLSPAEVLRIATREAARFLGQEDVFGSIRPGARADLLVVRGDVLEDLGPLRHPDAVILSGSRVH